MQASKLIAHRGDNTHFPENTLIAIKAALDAGATAFECDVQMNADNSLVVFHDRDFKRMNGNSDKCICEVSDDEMAELSVHDPEKFGQQYYPTRVTYLDEIIALLKHYPKVQAYIEIKNDSLEFFGTELVMNTLLKSLEGCEVQATIISFNDSALVYTKAHSQMRVGFVFEDFSEKMKAKATELNPDFLISWYKVLPEEKLWQGDWKWMIYTVNNLSLAKRLLQREEIDFIETDDIQLLLNG